MRSLELLPLRDGEERAGYPWILPAVAAPRDGITLDPQVTYLVGDNGSGKSTLIEAIAVAAGMNAEGGSQSIAACGVRALWAATSSQRTSTVSARVAGWKIRA